MPYNCHGRPPGAMRKTRTHDWLTPPCLLEALGALRWRECDGSYSLGPDPFDLDPCSSRFQPWPTAETMWDRRDDGLSRDWAHHPEVWLNPPYGTATPTWLARLAGHGSGLALVYARTDTAMFHEWVWGKASAVYFFEGRPWFHYARSGKRAAANCGGPMVLVVYGRRSLQRVGRLAANDSAYPGHLVPAGRKGGP